MVNSLFAQKIEVKGKVLNNVNKSPISGVNIFNIQKTRGTNTDFNGEFQLKTKINDTLIFSSIGYKSVKIIVKSSKLIVYLKEESLQLTEVIISTKSNINDIDSRKATGAVSRVSINKIKERSSLNIMESLQGQVAGVSIKATGELGKPVKIRIRGTSTLPIKSKNKNLTEEQRQVFDNRANQPLFVLDGQIITPEAFETLNVNDIKEIKILKDAVANALYGIKAANGVIEITGKRGIDGKTEYAISFQQGITLRGTPSVKMMQTEEKLNFERLTKKNNVPGYYYSEDFFRTFHKNNPNLEQLIAEGQKKLDSLKQINTDWFKELTRINTYQSYNISTRGGNKINKFYISGNLTKQGGKFDGNNINRFTGRLNYEYNLSKKVSVLFNSGFGISKSQTPNSSDYSPSQLIYRLNPYEQAQRGKLISYYSRTFKDLINQYSKESKDHRFNFSGNVFAKISKNLYFSSIIGVDYLFQGSLSIVPRTAFSEVKKGIAKEERGKAVKNKTTNINFSANTRLNFEKTIEKHKFSASANIDYYKSSIDFIGISGYGLPSKLNSGAGINNDLKGARKSVTSSKKVTNAQLGFGFSSLYEWNNKIDLYGSYKIDGSSLMPKDKRWNTFWATGVAYTISNENFLKNNKYISHLKLRATYGVTASLAGIEPSLAVPTFGYSKNGYLGIREFYLKNLFNKDLRPEKNISINLGLDIGIANIMNFTIEAYNRKTEDMLLAVPIAPSNGFYQQLKNVGIMGNRGVEISVNSTILSTDNFTWSTSGNLSYNQNKVISLYEGTELSVSGNPYPDYKEGKPTDLIYGLKSLGVHPADGIYRYRGANGREIHGAKDKAKYEDFIILGYSTPPYSGGWYHSFRYQNWQLSFDFYYNFGGKSRFRNLSVVTDRDGIVKNAVKGQLKNTWFEPGDNKKIYQSLSSNWSESTNNMKYATDKTVGRTDFIRMNNLMLQYRFDDEFLEKTTNDYISNLHTYMQLKNIATWSNFGGGDPESANLVGSSQPIISFGINLSF